MKKNFSEKDIREEFENLSRKVSEKNIKEVLSSIDEIIQKIKNSSFLSRERAKVELLIMALRDYWNGEYKELPYKTIVAIVVALIYILNPIDIIPDFIPIIGQIDDLAMLLFVWEMISEDIRDYALWKIKNSNDPKVRRLYEEAFGEAPVIA